MTPSIGVIVGRFQVPELHDGHLELFRTVNQLHPRVVVFLGLSPTRNATKRHPLNFETRERMIHAKFPEFTVLPLPDKRTDEEWSAKLDGEIDKLLDFGQVILYGSRDSFAPHYHGRHTVKELTLEKRVSGTQIRESLTNTVKESYDFRAGLIYGQQQRRPMLYTAVDIAILNSDLGVCNPTGDTMILLAQKPGFKQWRFPGGYAEPTSRSFVADARREAYEETGLDVSPLEYVSDRTIKDWRYEQEEDKIRSILFAGHSMTYGGQANDDISAVQWFILQPGLLNHIVPEHQAFFLDLISWNRKKQSEKAGVIH